MWGIWSHHMSYHTCPGVATMQHHRLLYNRVRRSNLQQNISSFRYQSAALMPSFLLLDLDSVLGPIAML